MRRGLFILLFCFLFWNAYAGRLILLTTSDLQGQVEPVREKEGSFGGFARIAWIVKHYKKHSRDPVFAVATGDDLMGEYFAHYKGCAIYPLLGEAGFDVATLGNHEFDQGPEVLAKALRCAPFPVVVANLRPTRESPLKGLLKPYVVLERKGLKVGFFGLITPDLPSISRLENAAEVEKDLVSVARKMAELLRRKEKVDVVVALTHIGLELDKLLAEKVPGIDVICGAHSHDLLKTPYVVRHPDGRKTVVIQTGTRGRFLGVLKLDVDGGVKRVEWVLVRVDSSIGEDGRVSALIERFKKGLPKARVIAETEVPIDLRSEFLRRNEAPIGDFVADLVRKRFKVDIVLLNSGGFRGDRIIPKGPITNKDIASIFPFGNTIVILKLKGKVVKGALERGVSAYPTPAGFFLQVSGIRMVFDPNRPPYRRIVSVQVCNDSGCAPLEDEKIYRVAVNSFMASGGDGYTMLARFVDRKDTYVTLRSFVESAVSELKIIAPAVDGRIKSLQ